jgi:hypothetical protein
LSSWTGVSTAGVGSEILCNSPSKESLDKWIRLFGLSSFTKWNRGNWALDISKGCNTRSVDVAISAELSPNDQ